MYTFILYKHVISSFFMSLTLRKLKRDNLKSQIRKITQTSTKLRNTTGTRIPDPPFSSFGPSRDYGMDICLEVYL